MKKEIIEAFGKALRNHDSVGCVEIYEEDKMKYDFLNDNLS